MGNSSFYFADQREVYGLFRGGGFFEGIFKYMADGEQRGFRNIYEASDDLEAWALGKFKAKLGIFATHDLYNAAFLFDDAAALSFNRAYERYILGLPYPTVGDRARAYATVTGERLSAVAAEIFRPENATLTIKGRRIDTAALREIILKM